MNLYCHAHGLHWPALMSACLILSRAGPTDQHLDGEGGASAEEQQQAYMLPMEFTRRSSQPEVEPHCPYC